MVIGDLCLSGGPCGLVTYMVYETGKQFYRICGEQLVHVYEWNYWCNLDIMPGLMITCKLPLVGSTYRECMPMLIRKHNVYIIGGPS